jgi:hypothetical protein
MNAGRNLDERRGDVSDMVLPCGYTMSRDGDTINLYYGAADRSVAPGANECTRSSRVAGGQWKLPTPTASAGLMKLLLRIYRFIFCCHHRQMSRVFTIKERTYQVCFKCAQEVEYSWYLMRSVRPKVTDDANAPLNVTRRAHVSAP